MEKNCLVTTYKATVNDNSLLKVGEMFIDIIEQETPTNQTNRLCLSTSDVSGLVVEVENGAANLTLDENMASGWTNKLILPQNPFGSVPVFVRNGNYRVKVSSKYNLTLVGRWSANIDQKAILVDTKNLKYSLNITDLLSNLRGNLADISGCTKLIRFTNIEDSFLNLTGSLSDLAPLTELVFLSLKKCTNLTGSLSDLAPLTKLTTLRITDCVNITGNIKDITQPLETLVVYNTKITGELIEFVKTQRLAGRTTGSCENQGWWGEYITFNGSVASTKSPLTWTENTITLGDVTVNQ